MSIYENAIDALICGVEDYQEGTRPRYKSALRNVYAGLLLILKEKLRLMAPGMGELMIAQRAIPELADDGQVIWIAKGHKTVDTQAIRERFDALGIKLDWKKFKEISDVRNNIEHKYTELKPEAVGEVIAKAFVILSAFMTDEMDLDIKDELGDEIYSVLISVKEVFEKERAECKKTWSNFKPFSKLVHSEKDDLFCPECASELVIIDSYGGLECRICGESSDYESVVEVIVENICGHSNYLSVKDGSEVASITCPDCGRDALVVDELICACCGESFFGDCQVCSTTIPVSEIDGSGICSWCQRQAEKVD